MRAYVFLPEVKRNRLVTNWVRARENQSTFRSGLNSARVKLKLGLLLGSMCLALVSGAGALVLDNSIGDGSADTVPSRLQGETAKDASADATDQVAQNPCGFEALDVASGSEKPSRGKAPNVEGFKSLASHVMGGILIADYKCASSRNVALIRVRWELTNATWQLKEISRPPLRQSGDF